MSPRSDEPPRRAPQARRGASRDLPPDEDREPGTERGFAGIGDARAYTPRGRTVAERDQRTRSPRAGRTTDPFRPALQVLDGGRQDDTDHPGRPRPGDRRPGDAASGSSRDRRTGEPHDDYDDPHDRAEPRGRARSSGDRTTRDRVGSDRADGDRTTRDRVGSDRADGDRTTRDRVGSDRADGDRINRGRAGSDEATRDRAGGDRAARDRVGGDRAARDRAGGDRAARDRAGSDRSRAGDRVGGRDRSRGRERAGGRERADKGRGRTAPEPDDERGTADRDRRTPARDRRPEAKPAARGRATGRPVERAPDRTGRTREPSRTGVQPPSRTTARDSRLRSAGTGRTGAGEPSPRGRKVAVAPAPRRTAVGRPARGGPPSRPGSVRPAPAVPAEPPKLANSTRRLRLGTVLALALFAAIGVRLVVLQVMESPASLESLEKLRDSRIVEVELPASRGSILDRSGVVLARSVEARFVYADPTLVTNATEVAAQLSPLLGMAPSALERSLARKKRPDGRESRFEYLARGVDITVADRIVALNLPGIGTGTDERRDLPGADLAANLIGFTGEAHTGLEGLEARYDDLLRGTDGVRRFERGNPAAGKGAGKGALAKEIPGGFRQEVPAQPGTSLTLTIDADLQYQVQKILSDQMEKANARTGGAVVIEVKSGDVLAQASYPAYNAAKPADYKPTDRQDVVSSIVTDPGSTHKAFIFGAALQEGIITPDSVLSIGPGFYRGGEPFFDFGNHRQPKGTRMTMPGLLAYSSNVGTILIADKLGPQRVYEYQQRFGLGRATGEGMPGEATGRILPPEEWSGSASGSIPIGHSVDATLIQMAAGYNAIANDGTYVQPHLIRSTVDPEGNVTPAPAPRTHQVLRPEVASQLRTMMEAVVTAKGGTGTRAAVDGFRVAGKTGTGSRLIKGQYTSYNASSFVGMAPAEAPRYVIAVSAEVPKGSTGGDVAAPPFSEMMAATLAHYRVAPTGTKAPEFKIHP